MDTKNIVRGVSNWGNKSGCRDFATIAEMNDAMVSNINACVKEDDVLYHVGDLVMGLFENVWEFRARLHCKIFTSFWGIMTTIFEKIETECSNLLVPSISRV